MLKLFIYTSLFLILTTLIFHNEYTFFVRSSGLQIPQQPPIIIIGSGLAGLSSAYTSITHGAQKVIILEKEKYYGGNSVKATSGINGALTNLQSENNITDSYELFIKDTMYSYYDGQETNEQNELIVKLVEDSTGVVNWLSSEAGLTELSQLGGHSSKRTHRPKKGTAGKVIIDALKARVSEFGEKVQFIYNATLSDIIINQETQQIQAIKYIDTQSNQEFTLNTHALILACGGFANDHSVNNSLLQEFAPELMNIPTTNGKFANGDCIKVARSKVNAKLIDMKEIQLHPTGFIDPASPNDTTKFLAPEALRGLGGILLNSEGERFVNELDLRSKVVDKIYENKDKFPIYLLLNEEIVKQFGPNFNFYWKIKNIFTEYNNLEDMCNKTGLNYTIIQNVFNNYSQAKKNGIDQFGKKVFTAEFNINEKLYLSQITPVIHYTMGGLQINKQAQILNNQGLYGAGEITGGVHGKNRLGGNSLLDCAVYGQQAGISASQYIKEYKEEL